ncbi:MAG: T9SS type A sorting domain-containing protein, partial [Phaeodactylibacter sp.]|nr:T9SS type A sorting domain-containing protein [Phaeodactylibacter sp.]
NTTSNTRLGFRFEGMGDAVQFQGNTIQDHFDGLLIEEAGAIGLQEHHGNLWCGTYGGTGARHLAQLPANVLLSAFIVEEDSSSTQNCVYLPSFEANAQWFDPQVVDPGTTFQCITDSGDACSTTTPGSGEEPGEEDELLQKLADGSFESPKFEEALKWTGQRHLYYRLLNKEEEALESWEEDFLDEYESTTVGDFSLVDTTLNAAFTLGEHTTAALDSLQSEMESKLDSLHWVDWQFNFGIEIDTAALLAKHQSLLDSLSYLRQQGADQMEAIQLYREDFLEEAEMSNSSISANEVFEVNEQDVNSLFLETVAMGVDTFTEAQITDLWTIANQCPLAGGDAVFMARSLYSLIDPLVKYEDEERCASEPEARPKTTKVNAVSAFRLIPNPARNEIQITFAQPLDGNATIVIYDTQGRMQQVYALEAGQAVFSIDTGHLPAGLFYCRLLGVEGLDNAHKLVIIR